MQFYCVCFVRCLYAPTKYSNEKKLDKEEEEEEK